MTLSFSEKLAAKKRERREAPKTADVTVSLATDAVRYEIEQLERERDTLLTDQRLTSTNGANALTEKITELRAKQAESLVTLRFTQMDGVEWTALTAQYPPRLDVPLEAEQYGYNVQATTMAACYTSGCVVDEDGTETFPVVDKTAEPKIDEWADLWHALDGAAAQEVADTIWGLNVYYPQIEREALKKAQSELRVNTSNSH